MTMSTMQWRRRAGDLILLNRSSIACSVNLTHSKRHPHHFSTSTVHSSWRGADSPIANEKVSPSSPKATPSSSSTSSSSPSPTSSQSLLALLTSRRFPSSLPTAFSSLSFALSAEIRHIHSSHPFFAAPSSLLPSAGSHFTLELGDASVIIVRGEDRKVRGLFNHCTHQNARICSSSRPDLAVIAKGGSPPPVEVPLQSAPICYTSAKLICPFHHWTFSLEGDHLAPRTALTADPQQREHFALTKVKRIWDDGGLLFIDCQRSSSESSHPSSAFPPSMLDDWKEIRNHLENVLNDERSLKDDNNNHYGIKEGWSLIIDKNWKFVWSALSSCGKGLFPSLLFCENEGGAVLIQLLPLTKDKTALTGWGVLGDGMEWKGRVENALQDFVWSGDVQLPVKDRYRYDEWMIEGMRVDVEKEEKARQEHERRRNKLLGLS